MTNRVLLSAGTFLVSAPGYNVTNASIAVQNLLIDNTNSTMGVYVTGQVNPVAQGYENLNDGVGVVRIPFVNNMGGYVPFGFAQQASGGGLAIGYSYSVNTTVNKEYVDTIPPSYFTTTTYQASVLEPRMSTNQMQVYISDSTDLIRYLIFWPQASANVYPSGNITLAAMTWPNAASGGSSSVTIYQTVSNVNMPITLQIISSLTPNANTTISAYVNASANLEYDMTTNSNSMYISVQNGNQLSFGILQAQAGANTQTTLSVYNVTGNSPVLVNNVSIGAYQTVLYPQNNPVWSNVASSVQGWTNGTVCDGMTSSTIFGSILFSNIYGGMFGVNYNPTYTANVYTQNQNMYNSNAALNGPSANYIPATTYTNVNNISFTIYDNSIDNFAEGFYFAPWANYRGTATIWDNSTGQAISTFYVNVAGLSNTTINGFTLGQYLVAQNTASSSVTSITGTTSSCSVGPISTAHTLKISAYTSTNTAQTCSGTTLYFQVYKNGSFYANFTSSTSLSFTANPYDVIYLSGTCFNTYNSGYVGTLLVTDTTASNMLIANVEVLLTTAGTGGGGGCCWDRAYLPSGIRIGDAQINDEVLLLEADGNGYRKHSISDISPSYQQCATIITESGIELTCSYSTPIMYRNDPTEKEIHSDTLEKWIVGKYLPVLDNDDFRWEKIVRLDHKGNLLVRLLSCDDNIYAAGDKLNRYIFTHNMTKAIKRLAGASQRARNASKGRPIIYR